RITVAEELADEQLVDDGNGLRVGSVRVRECSAGSELESQRLEVFRRRRNKVRNGTVRWIGVGHALNGKQIEARAGATGHGARDRGGLDARLVMQPLEQGARIAQLVDVALVGPARQRELPTRNLLGYEAERAICERHE